MGEQGRSTRYRRLPGVHVLSFSSAEIRRRPHVGRTESRAAKSLSPKKEAFFRPIFAEFPSAEDYVGERRRCGGEPRFVKTGWSAYLQNTGLIMQGGCIATVGCLKGDGNPARRRPKEFVSSAQY